MNYLNSYEYFTWNNVMELSQNFNVSCYEISNEIDDNGLFVYNQIAIEYSYWYKCNNRKSNI